MNFLQLFVNCLIQKIMNPHAKLFVFVAAILILTTFNVSAAARYILGPTNNPESWYNGQYGAATISVDLSDPFDKDGYDLVINNTNAGPENKADWRSQPFPLGPAAGGAKPITFTFSYKLPDTVAKRNNIHVQLRFFDSTGTRFMGEKVIPVGAQTGDSEMTGYKTITMSGIKAPRKAQTADVWINAGSFEPWSSGNAQFASIFVTTVPPIRWSLVLCGLLAILVALSLTATLIARKRSSM
jgi:hypothetical protein